ncbi:hypothetical protein D5S17_27035 [Pseudonocardiaceae bacterium YIM PH 21723]|nr:hypothetical protein D5S17_27035 [Pseudonocardiaceae bacterium YIM PH 21723]
MSDGRGWGLGEAHLATEAVAAFVDGELTAGPAGRAAGHVARCRQCADEVNAQRQARAAVRSAGTPGMSASFLEALRAIPQHTELPGAPDGLAITEDGQLVAVQRTPSRGFAGGPVLGTSTPLGSGDSVLGGRKLHRRTIQGAGVVFSGLVLGALALVVPLDDSAEPAPPAPAAGDPQRLAPAHGGAAKFDLRAPGVPTTSSPLVGTSVLTPAPSAWDNAGTPTPAPSLSSAGH